MNFVARSTEFGRPRQPEVMRGPGGAAREILERKKIEGMGD